MINRRQFLQSTAWAGGTLALAGCGISPPTTGSSAGATPEPAQEGAMKAAKPGRRPNILIILADDMGYSDIGCFGSEIHTPNLDRLAAGGTRFTQMYNCARCCPTRASLLTGLYPHQAGIGYMIKNMKQPNYEGWLNDRCVTLAEALGSAGYRTLMSGKWHVGGAPEHWPCRRGFDESFSLIGGAANYWGHGKPATYARNDQKVAIDPESGFYITDAFTDRAIEFLDQPRPAEQPFFLYLAYTAPHWPLHAFESDIAKYRGRYRIGWEALRRQRHQRMVEMGIVDPEWGLSPWPDDAPAWPGPLGEDEMDLRMAVYAAQIDRMDQGIGRVLQKLRAMGEEDNTMILFLSDNGGCAEVRENSAPGAVTGTPDSFVSYTQAWATASNTPFRKYKRWVYEGGVSAPMIGYWPGVIHGGGALSHAPAHVMDIMSTCLDAAGAPYPTKHGNRPITPTEGRSFLPTLRGEPQSPRPAIYWEHEGHSALRDGEWKLVCDQEKKWELYNMRADRCETHDLATAEPQRVAKMSAAYEQWASRCGVVSFSEMIAKLHAQPVGD